MKCGRPGCDGTIDSGYCDTCGLAPAGERQPAADLASVSVAGGPPPEDPRRAGADLPSTPLTGATRGSARASGAVSARSSSRGHLGAGLVEIPPVEDRDPASVVMADPQVAESRRRCARCDNPVGRSRDGRPGRTEGYCPHCGARYSFTPKLVAGDLVAGQYEVAGCLAYGGMGWVYLARDHNVSDRWVVLKGLLDSGDESAMAAAIAERRFLAEVEHPNIVRIYNFVEHHGAGYIVMEYVGGTSLKDLRKGADGSSTPLPVGHAIAYLLEALPALAHLHTRNLLYCDFKPDNVIQTEEQVKIIDLGGVRRMDDDTSDLYGTVGYQAPEVPRDGPSVASDLYTVARTLAVLVFDFKGFQDPRRYADSLPPASDVPIFQRYPALHRFLLRGTHPDPTRRFGSAGEMAEQLTGVLRQVVAIDGGRPDPAPSRLFTPELGLEPDQPTWRVLPVPAIDPTDPAAGVLASLAAASPAQMLAALEGMPDGPDIRFQRARAYLELGEWKAAADVVVQQAIADPLDWRSRWWQAVLELVEGVPKDAAEDFDRVAAELPGELAPLLGLAVAAESSGDIQRAAALYQLVAGTDPGHVSASFGLARIRRATGDRHGAAEALRRVPSASSAHQAALVALCSILTGTGPASGLTGTGPASGLTGTGPASGLTGTGPDGPAAGPNLDDLVDASGVLVRLNGDARVSASIKRDLLIAALRMVEAPAAVSGTAEVAGVPLKEDALRAELEKTCRTLAKLSPTDSERVALVDEANAFRPRSLT
jgi:serine/threonine-protein kinase PknG